MATSNSTFKYFLYAKLLQFLQELKSLDDYQRKKREQWTEETTMNRDETTMVRKDTIMYRDDTRMNNEEMLVINYLKI